MRFILGGTPLVAQAPIHGERETGGWEASSDTRELRFMDSCDIPKKYTTGTVNHYQRMEAQYCFPAMNASPGGDVQFSHLHVV